MQHVREIAHVVRHRRDLVELDALGGGLDVIHHVIHARDQAMDLIAIDRRDERLVQCFDAAVRDRIGLVLDVGDPPHFAGCSRRSTPSTGTLWSFDRERGVLLEEVEKAGLPR